MIIEEFDYTLIEEPEEKEKFPCFPLPISVTNAEGSYLTDTEGKKYLDLTSGRENNPFGYSNSYGEGKNCFFDSGLFNSAVSKKLEENLKKITGLDKTNFSPNSDELYALTRRLINTHIKSAQKTKILVCTNSADKKLYEIPGVDCELIPINKDTLLKTTFSKSVGAVIVKLVQTTDDEILITEDEYLKDVSNMCKKNHALLILDSTGGSPLRLNKGLFNFNPEIKPDILIISTGTAGGFPFGAVITSENSPSEENFNPGTGIYSSAYSVATKLTEEFLNGEIQKTVNNSIKYISEKLADLENTHISLVDFYSEGMLFTLVTDISAYKTAEEVFKNGVIVDTKGDNKIILSPPLNINEEDTDYFIKVLDKAFDKLAEFDRLK